MTSLINEAKEIRKKIQTADIEKNYKMDGKEMFPNSNTHHENKVNNDTNMSVDLKNQYYNPNK